MDEFLLLKQKLLNDEINTLEAFDILCELNLGKHANSPWNSVEWKKKRLEMLKLQRCCSKCGRDPSLFRSRNKTLTLQHIPGDKYRLSDLGMCETKEEFLEYIEKIIKYRSLETVSLQCAPCAFHADSSSPILNERKKERRKKRRKKRIVESDAKPKIDLSIYFEC